MEEAMKLLKPPQVAMLLNSSTSLVYNLMKEGRLPFIRIGTGKQGGKRIREDDLERFLEENRVVSRSLDPPVTVRLKHLKL